jgi:hypothetical protein
VQSLSIERSGIQFIFIRGRGDFDAATGSTAAAAEIAGSGD